MDVGKDLDEFHSLWSYVHIQQESSCFDDSKDYNKENFTNASRVRNQHGRRRLYGSIIEG